VDINDAQHPGALEQPTGIVFSVANHRLVHFDNQVGPPIFADLSNLSAQLTQASRHVSYKWAIVADDKFTSPHWASLIASS
jgi:hypothetical protein